MLDENSPDPPYENYSKTPFLFLMAKSKAKLSWHYFTANLKTGPTVNAWLQYDKIFRYWDTIWILMVELVSDNQKEF